LLFLVDHFTLFFSFAYTFLASFQNQLRDGLRIAMAMSKLGNGYLQTHKPWDLFKTDPARSGTVLNTAANLVRLLALVFEPFMPAFTAKVLSQLNWPAQLLPARFEHAIPGGHKLGTPAILFQKMDDAAVAAFKKRFSGAQESTSSSSSAAASSFPLDIRGATIAAVADHPEDKELFLVTIDLGKEKRQVVGRLKSVYTAQQLLNKQVVVLCNLPPATIKVSDYMSHKRE
jgi:methionyl-tRNA synthetase